MGAMTRETDANPYRLLPKVDAALRDSAVAALESRVGAGLLASFVAETVDAWREQLAQGRLDAAGLTARLQGGALASEVARRVREEEGRGVTRAINAAGVVMHTGLGRSPVHPEVAEAMGTAARGYCVLEVDRFTGQRNQRDERLSELLRRLTGAEAGIAVNNNAAAAFLTMHTFASGREAIVSRGELVEIGGSFRVPDVMSSAGVKLVEVGATNRTRIADYERAIGTGTGLLMKVHSSNFRMVGFTEEVPMPELAELGRARAVPTAFDLGSGRLEADGARPLDMLGGETLVREAVESGIEVVSFSGDKLLGGPQAGLLVGSAERIAALRQNPIYRAMRLDKSVLAGLEATVGLLLAGRGDEVPTRRMLLLTADELRPVAQALAAGLEALDGVKAEIAAGESEPGSGSAPGEYLATFVVRMTCEHLSPERLAARLRAGEPPVFARIQDDALVLDPRTLLPGDLDQLIAAVSACL
jgi:L-seryl-tRNA(Ser) seleniumtransferase